MGYICGRGCQIEQMDPFTQTHSGINSQNSKKTTNGRLRLANIGCVDWNVCATWVERRGPVLPFVAIPEALVLSQDAEVGRLAPARPA